MKEKLIIKEFDDFNEKHDIKYSKKKIDQRKVYFFMFCAAKENKYINGREDCNVILIKLGIYSKSIDSIQRFNKIEQKGYKRNVYLKNKLILIIMDGRTATCLDKSIVTCARQLWIKIRWSPVALLYLVTTCLTITLKSFADGRMTYKRP